MLVTKVALVGMGTVGAGVARLLIDHGDRTGRHAGRVLWVEEVVVADPAKARDYKLPKTVTLSDDLTRITKNPEIKIVAHLVGGLEPARTIMLKLLESGKDVVTANKALLAEHGGPMLFGDFGIADAYFAPVCSRIRTYALPVSPTVAAYVDRVHQLPAVQTWVQQALAEHDFIDFDEPYRSRP